MAKAVRLYPTSCTTRRTYTGQIELADLREVFNIPPGAKVYVTVPGGADWSGMDLEIGDDLPIQIRWEETSDK